MAGYRKRGGMRKRGGPRKRGGVRRGAKGRANGGLVRAVRTATVPDRTILRMKYVDNIVLTGIGGASRVFRLNSMYDPDTSVTNGHQPLGYDQWNTFYNKYRVFKADVVLTFTNSSSNNADTEQVGFVAYNDQASPPQGDAFFEQPHCKSVMLSGRGGMDKGVIRYSVNLPRILGMAPVVYKSATTTSALFGSNPAEQVLGAIFVRPIDGQSTSLVSCQVWIQYHCELFDRTQITISYPQGKNPDAADAADGRLEDQ